MTSSPPKVLVVDDDRQFRAAVAEALTDLGYAPSQVPGAQEALHELEAERYDVVLLDLRMPGLSGHDLLRRLERGIPVVAMSGTGTMDDVIAVLRRGAVDFLRKPFGPRQLEQSLRRALGEGAPPPQGAPNLRQDPTGGWSRPSHDRREAVQRVDRAGPDTAADPCHHLAQALHDGEIELPAIAPIAEDVRRLLRDPTCPVEQVVAVVERDPTIIACLLKLANSSYYGGQVPAQGVRAACLRLGNQQALSVAHQVLVHGLFDLTGELAKTAEAMWRNTVVSSFVARDLATRVGLPDPQDLHLSAMLHNLGELVLLRAFGKLVAGRRCPDGALEALAGQIGRHHEEVGRRLMKAWGMPSDLVLLAGAHHRKPWRPESKEATTRRRLIIASWSGACRAGYSYLPGDPPPDPEELLRGLGLGPEDMAETLVQAERWLETASGESP